MWETIKTTALGTFVLAFIVFAIKMIVFMAKRNKPADRKEDNKSDEEIFASIIEEGEKSRKNLEKLPNN